MRERAEIRSVSREGLGAVTHYLIPRYREQMPDGRMVYELHGPDLARVRAGYACGECLAAFERRFETCPSCGHPFDPARDIVDYYPDYWQDYEGRTSAEILSGSD
jgi:hypothetical protein